MTESRAHGSGDENGVPMSDNDSFVFAYHTAYVEGDEEKAILLCEKILVDQPRHHDAKMLLGSLLAKSKKEEALDKAVQLFRSAAMDADYPGGRNYWLEENPIFHLALIYQYRGDLFTAAVLYATDLSLNKTRESAEELFKILREDGTSIGSTVADLLAKLNSVK
jgi:tetratricopeptide (TPR) repeat protein